MKKNAFTIIEILITMIIMGTMSATLVPRIGDARKRTDETVELIKANRNIACTEGLDDLCVDNGSSNGGGGADTSNGVHYDPTGDGIYDIRVCREGECITIQDRNLGATTTGAGPNQPSTSWGYYYKWGNNTPYMKESPDYSYVSDNNAWGGGNDIWNRDDLTYYLTVNNLSDRKGPCPDGYHVPSRWEYNALMYLRKGEHVSEIRNSNAQEFYHDMQIPFAGVRLAGRGTIGATGSYTYLLTTTPSSLSDHAVSFEVTEWSTNSLAYFEPSSRKNGYSVRCFKN